MLGSFLSSVTKIVTIPVDVAEIGLDALTGGDGDRRNLRGHLPTPLPSDLRDRVADAFEDIDR